MTQRPDLDDLMDGGEDDFNELGPPPPDHGLGFCLAGAALLAVGAFLPAVSMGPQSMSLIGAGQGDGWVLLVLAALTVVFIFRARSWVLLSGVLAAGFVGYKLVTLGDAMSSAGGQLEWGWPLLFIGLGLIFWGYLSSPW